MKDEDVIAAVRTVNDEIIEKTAIGDVYLTFSTNGYESSVEVDTVQIWVSGDDTRIYNEDSDSYEPIEDCIRRRFCIFAEKMGKVGDAISKKT